MQLLQVALLLVISLPSTLGLQFNELNEGGLGTSEFDAIVYYLIGDAETYPNLKLSLWSEEERFDKENFGTVKL